MLCRFMLSVSYKIENEISCDLFIIIVAIFSCLLRTSGTTLNKTDDKEKRQM